MKEMANIDLPQCTAVKSYVKEYLFFDKTIEDDHHLLLSFEVSHVFLAFFPINLQYDARKDT